MRVDGASRPLVLRRIITALIFLGTTCPACANPVIIDPTSLVAFWVIVLTALAVEAGIAALIVTLSGLAPARVFFAFLAGNAAIYFMAFRPLLEQGVIPVMALEMAVVGADASFIKLLGRLEVFQSDGFVGLSWFRAVVAATAGNGFSYLVGQIANSPY